MPSVTCPAAVNALRYPRRAAISWSGRSVAWDMFNNYVHSTSRYLKEIAVRPGQRVLIVSESSPAYVIALLALWRIGAVLCPVIGKWAPEQVISLRRELNPAITISSRGARKAWASGGRWADIEQIIAYGYNDSFLGSDKALDPTIDTRDEALLRLVPEGSGFRVVGLTHEQLQADPRELKSLFHALATGETIDIVQQVS